MSTKAEQLEWRRSKVVKMRARGLSYGEIAQQLQVSRASISSDIQYLRNQAKETIREFVTEHLPEQYQICLTALDSIIKRAFDILKIVKDINPDIVHIQSEPGMYGSILDPVNRSNSRTYIDYFYFKCKTPAVTTFHSDYNFIEWISQSFLIKKEGRIGIFGVPLRFAAKFFSHLLTYNTFNNLNKQKLDSSHSDIVFSNYMSDRIGGGCRIIHHGTEPYDQTITEKKEETRAILSLPQDSKLALAFGFRTVSKDGIY